MKNIRTISRGNNGVALQFMDKKSSSEFKYQTDKGFVVNSPISLEAEVEILGEVGYDQYKGNNSRHITFDLTGSYDNLETSTDNILIEFEFRRDDRFDTSRGPNTIFQLTSGGPTFASLTVTNQEPGIEKLSNTAGFFSLNSPTEGSSDLDFADGEWHTFSLTLTLGPGQGENLTIDGNDLTATYLSKGQPGGPPNWGTYLASNDFICYVAGDSGAVGYPGFVGAIRNFKITVGSHVLVDAPIPSLGNNAPDYNGVTAQGTIITTPSQTGGIEKVQLEYILEAPQDGLLYGRRDGEWIAIV